MSENQQPNQEIVLGGAAASASAQPRKEESTHNCLPIGTRLGEFEIVGLVGEGGFGIVYLAQDHSLQRKIALKEYMPASLASRGSDASVIVRSERHQETFNIGRRSFVNEARLLAQFDHPALVKVYRFWEANGTAYMVMPFYEGKTLREVLYENEAPPPEAWIKKILAPVIDALELIHRDNCFHRDIAPDNIILLPGDRPILLDFGAARRVIGDMTQALTVILKPGYAPIEQYAEMPGMKQGAWTDIYALAAVIYFMIARKLPPPSVTRIMQDTYEPLASVAIGHYSETLLKGVDLCLTVRPEQRPKTMAEMREVLGMHATQVQATPILAQQKPATKSAGKNVPASPSKTPDTKSSSSRLPLIAVAGTFAILGGVGYYLSRESTPSQPQPSVASSAPSVVETSPVVATEKPTPVEKSKPTFNSLDEAFKALSASADPKMTPNLVLAPTVAVDGGSLKLTVKTAVAGHLYLFLWDKGEDKFYRIFPNDLDKATALSAGTSFTVPRSNLPIPWSFPASDPKGSWQVLALVSELPRDLSRTKFAPDGGFASSGLAVLNTALAGGAGVEAIIGSIPCETNNACADRFGLVSATTEEVAAAPVVATPEKKVEPSKPARTQDTPQKPQPTDAGARKQAGGGTKPADDSDRAEREYMKQLNKDLDKLLGK